MPSMSGCFWRTWASRCSYTYFVDTPASGFANRIWQWGRGARGVIFSPIPSARVVPPTRQKGMSAPSCKPSSISRARGISRSKRRQIPFITAAASVLPPTSPAAMGIFFSRWMCTPRGIWYSFLISMAARKARLSSPRGISLESQVRVMPSPVFSRVTRSHRSMACMTIFTRWYPSCRFPVTSRPRLILACAFI